jgi:hypothetical protein
MCGAWTGGGAIGWTIGLTIGGWTIGLTIGGWTIGLTIGGWTIGLTIGWAVGGAIAVGWGGG